MAGLVFQAAKQGRCLLGLGASSIPLVRMRKHLGRSNRMSGDKTLEAVNAFMELLEKMPINDPDGIRPHLAP